MSGSGLMFASFSLLSISVISSANFTSESEVRGVVSSGSRVGIFNQNVLMIRRLLLTITRSDSLTSRRKGNCFSHCQFTYMKIMLTYISWRPLRNKLIHCMAIVCHSPRNLWSPTRRYQVIGRNKSSSATKKSRILVSLPADQIAIFQP